MPNGDPPDPLLLATLVVVVLAVAVAILLGVVRFRYGRRVRAHGFTLVRHPGPEPAWGLNCPPFGLGSEREVTNLITGAAPSGGIFSAFTYDYKGVSPQFVLRLPLTRALPELHLAAPANARAGLVGATLPLGRWEGTSPDPAWARSAGPRLVPHLDALAALVDGVTVSLDGDSVVVAPAPREPDLLQRLLVAAAPLAQTASALEAAAPVVPPEWSVYRHPGWIYRARDDAALDRVDHSRGGHNHRADDVIYADDHVLRLTALTHTWDTTETRLVSNGQGGTHTQTYTEHHREAILEIALRFPFRDLRVNQGLGRSIRFESEDFNRAFHVRCADERFAYDVFPAPTMEWLLARGVRPFTLADGIMTFAIDRADAETAEDCLGFAQGFFGRVRRYVWQNLGVEPPLVPTP